MRWYSKKCTIWEKNPPEAACTQELVCHTVNLHLHMHIVNLHMHMHKYSPEMCKY